MSLRLPFFPALPLRDFDGPLTQDLVQRPGEFGLGNVPTRLAPDAVAHSVCGFCSTGCRLRIHLRDGEAINLSADPDWPVNTGMACPKGWEALAPLESASRATAPLLRDRATGKASPVSWEVAAGLMAEKFKAIIAEHGPDSVAWLGTGQMPSEELAFLGALAKFGLGFVHGDANTRQCMATAVAAYKESFGFDAPPCTYADLEESDVIILAGSNLCIAHPILWQRVRQNRRGARVIVIDPRRTETAAAADEHIALVPKSDLLFLYSVAHEIIAQGWTDEAFLAEHTSGYDEFASAVAAYPAEIAAPLCGVPAATIRGLARTIHEGKAVSLWWTMGVNQSHEATRTAQAVIALALLTGNIGKPGAGPMSITGQCNAMGSRLFSNTTNLCGGHDFANAAHREKVAGVLGIPVERIPSRSSWAYDQILERIADGTIKGLWIIATNPVHSWIGSGPISELLGKLEFLAVQDMYGDTETARLADLMLPAAGWGEKEGTFINSERRIGVIRAVKRAPGSALSDFRIFRLIAQAAGVEEMFSRWTSPEAAFQLMRECTRGQPCDITGIRDYAMLDEHGGIQWPWPDTETASPGTQRRLFSDGKFYTPDARARFTFSPPRPPAEVPDERHPFVLLTGRGTSAQWHTGTRTERSAILRRLRPDTLQVEVHPEDAAPLRLTAGAWVTVVSRRGSVRAQAVLTSAIRRGAVYLPMHHPGVNVLTCPSFDPHSRQPSYKHCAVRLEL